MGGIMIVPVTTNDVLLQWENRSGYWTIVAYKPSLNQSAGVEVATLQPNGELHRQVLPVGFGLPVDAAGKWKVV